MQKSADLIAAGPKRRRFGSPSRRAYLGADGGVSGNDGRATKMLRSVAVLP
jgi:hypothetical protein